jgi:2-octaprenyl-6-methoxyphenol hydroxylase
MVSLGSVMQKAVTVFDLVIVGGGIVGSVLAACLAASDLRIAVVEHLPLASVRQRRRAYAMSLLSRRIFQDLGLWEEIAIASGQYRHIQLSDGDFSQTVRFIAQDLKSEYLGFSGQHEVLLGALHRRLEGCANIEWFCPAQVLSVDYGAERAIATLETESGEQIRLEARLVVGADGARSPIRQAAGISTKGWKYWQSCLTFEVEHHAPRNDIAFERFWGTGPMGVLPLPGNRCQIVWTNPHKKAQQLQALDEAEFLEYLQPFVKPLGQVKLVGDRLLFPVQLMQSDRYVQPRLALIGDAAHCCHPVGGQGLNLGIRDAAALAQVLIAAQKRHADIGELNTLRHYENWRKLENLIILSFTDLLNRLFSTDFFLIVLIRRLSLMLLSSIQPLKLFALKLMTGQKGKQPMVFLSK